jgi:hypothetical protein
MSVPFDFGCILDRLGGDLGNGIVQAALQYQLMI